MSGRCPAHRFLPRGRKLAETKERQVLRLSKAIFRRGRIGITAASFIRDEDTAESPALFAWNANKECPKSSN